MKRLELDDAAADAAEARGSAAGFFARTLQREYMLLAYEELRRNHGHQWFDMRKRLAFGYVRASPLAPCLVPPRSGRVFSAEAQVPARAARLRDGLGAAQCDGDGALQARDA